MFRKKELARRKRKPKREQMMMPRRRRRSPICTSVVTCRRSELRQCESRSEKGIFCLPKCDRNVVNIYICIKNVFADRETKWEETDWEREEEEDSWRSAQNFGHRQCQRLRSQVWKVILQLGADVVPQQVVHFNLSTVKGILHPEMKICHHLLIPFFFCGTQTVLFPSDFHWIDRKESHVVFEWHEIMRELHFWVNKHTKQKNNINMINKHIYY